MHIQAKAPQLRLAITILIGLIAGALCYNYQVRFQRGGGDINWATRLLLDLFAGVDPYGYPVSETPSAYPLTAGVVTLPLALFSPEVAAGVFFGLSSGLLAWGLTKGQQWWRLLVFLAMPYWQALITVQWSPLFFAIALFPALLPLTLVKPHIGLPIILTHLTLKRAIACVLFGLGSLVLLPDWPLRWLNHQAAPGQYLPPLAILPFGPLLLLAGLRWRYAPARFLCLLACVPQRLWYDVFLIFLIPTERRAMVGLVASSWLAWVGWYFVPSLGTTWAIILLYLPALAWVLLQSTNVMLPTPWGSTSTTSEAHTLPGPAARS